MKKPFLQQPHRLGSRVVARPGQADVSADSSLKPKSTRGSTPLAAAVVALASLSLLAPANAADKTYDFTTDPSADLTIAGNGVNDAPWVSSGGNPGGFLAITYPQDGMSTTVVFPNLDPGKIVTGFTFTCDLRVGNSEGDRPADGFSISFARDGDPILTDPNSDAGFAGNCCPETGTKTGIAVSFDTWSGNVFPNDPSDTTDIEGIIVRVDDRTVQKVSLPTRHGTADDITSLQTGPRDAQFWTDSTDHIADSRTPASWDTLQWRPFGITMTEDGKLTVIWKGNKVLDNFQTTYFPTAGQLVFAGRTGGESEHTHVDNIHLTTTAAAVTAVPGAPPNFQASVGARRVGLSWGAAVVEGDPNARVAYEIERDGVVIVPITTALSYEDRFVEPNKTYTYKVRGKNIAGNPGPDSTKSATTTGEVAGTFFLPAEQWLNLQGTWDTAVQEIVGVPPAITRYVNGFSFGETSNFGNTWGENHLVKISGVFTAPESGNFRFFLRSDDSSALFVKAGTTPPDPSLEFPIATETQCCGAFAEPNPAAPPEETSEPIALTAGAKYGITLVVKEGGGGDWGQVATRKEGELIPTKASTLTPLRGAVLAGLVDTLGATVSITTNPADATVNANSSVSFTAAATGSSPYGGDYGNVVAYQWYNGGVPVLNANGPTYTIQYPSKALSGNKIKVVAAVAGATATSTEATLTVNDDVTPPTVTRISGSATFDSMTVVYSEPVSDSALTVGNYNIPGLTLSSPTRLDALSVRFATTKQTEDTSYPVTINGVQDLAGLPSAYTGTFYSFVFKPGQVVYKTWQGQTGPFTDFTDAVPPVGSLPPSSISLRNEFVSNDGDEYENYFGQVSGFFIPATSGNYVFFLSSDDHGELYLSTDADPANKKKIAEEPSWSARRYWVGNGVDNNSATRGEPGSLSNRSDQYPSTEWTTGVGGDISLTAGNRYYVEVLYKEGGGGDHGGVTVIKKGDPDPANTTSTLLGNLIGTYVDPTTFPPIITTRPSTVKYSKGETVSFSVQAESKLPLTYKWYHNKHLIPGATGATLTIPNAGVLDIGDYYVDVSNANGTATSFPDNDSRAIMKGAYVIEMEDYNYDSGHTVAGASTMPLVSDQFVGKNGIPGIDFHNGSPSGGGDGDNGNSYRNGWLDNGVVRPSPTGPETGGNLDVIIDNGATGGGEPNTVRPDYTLTNNYKIGWGGTGNWYQYTRSFEPGNYNAVWVGSRDGRDADAMGRTMELVTGDITQPNAATTVVGELTASWTGGWSANDSIPFLTPGATTAASIPLGANTTLRVRISKGDGDNDYLLFYPAGTITIPTLTSTFANGVLTLTYTGVLESSGTLNGNFDDVAGAVSPYVVPMNAAAQLYRTHD